MSADALVAAAETHRLAGRLNDAEQALRDALLLDPQHADAWHTLGILEIQRGRYADALASLEQAIALTPARPKFQHHYGVALRNNGRLEEAAAAFRRAWELDPGQVDSGIKLADVLERLDRLDESIDAYRRVLQQRPKDVAVWNSLGIALYRAEQLDEACRAYRRAIEVDPRRPEPHNNLANALRLQGNLDAAEKACRQALALKSDYARAHYNLGTILIQKRRFTEALSALQMALVYKPDMAEAHDDLGHVLVELGRPREALECCQAAIDCNPNYMPAWNNLGTLYNDLKRYDDAQRCFERAIALNPKIAEAHNNLGNVFKMRLDFEQAEACYHRALALRPNYGKAHYNLGNILFEYGQLDEAAACYDRAVECSPEYAEAHFQRGAVRLLRGDFGGGWPEYEWRWGMENGAKQKRTFAEPLWDGSPLHGKTILLYAEQGLGDTFQFIRYAPLVQARGGQVLVECQAKLRPLLQSAPGIDRLVPKGEPLPPFDCQAPLLSLPHILGTTVETIPGGVPYLAADPALVAEWREELAGVEGFKVGIVWQGSPTFLRDATRSIPLAEYLPLADVLGVQLIALQKGAGADQLDKLADELGIVTLPDDVDTTRGAYMDTAAIMMSLDLIISSDTSAAHLAGALGRPVWVALGFAPDWRWLLGRDDSPWYPTMRLFRQQDRRDWAGVFAAMAAELERRVQARP